MILTQPWAITRAALEELAERYRAHLAAGSPAPQPRRGRATYMQRVGAIAVIDVSGPLMPRPGLLDALFDGASSTDFIAADVEAAAADPAIRGIILNVSSPGGTVDGTQELAGRVRAATAKKPVVALANGMMASAAYWIGSAASSIFATAETAAIGSIGVLALHWDLSERERMLGIRATPVYAGKYKAIASHHAPLSSEGRAVLQEQVDVLYSIFVEDVARNRRLPAAEVTAQESRLYIGRQALAARLVDGFASLNQLVADLDAGKMPVARAAARQQTAAPIALEARCKQAWDRDAKLRSEFLSYETYLAYRRAAEKIKSREQQSWTY